MRVCLCLVLGLLALPACSAEIRNFVSGAVCSDAAGVRSVCQQTKEIYVTAESSCNWSGKQLPCTWFGFEFDYKDADPHVPLECTYVRSQASDEGNFEGVRERNTTTGTLTYRFDSAVGHFFNPMYQLFSREAEQKHVVLNTQIACSVSGVHVFDVTFNLHFGRQASE
jgi:hypothetical protein